jgi:2-methylcitrate dehydratase PrpD
MHTPSSLSYQLGSFVREFPGDDLPDDVLQLAKFCLIDAVGCTIHGRAMPWTKLLFQQIDAIGKAGDCRLFEDDQGLNAQHAALLWGSSCHAFELDNLRRPGAGVHPGACIAMPALALAIENQNTGRQLLEAIALGIEGMFRIGLAAKHSSEKLGFHAPGITGPFGAALASSRLLGLSADQTSFSMGLCGSLAGGLLEFSQANQGGMVKRLHMGRAAESGLLAARLSQRGYEGPHSILEGTFGILNVFCQSRDPSRILDGLGIRWESRTMCFKKYPSHITTQAILEFLQRHGFPDRSKADQIRELVLHVPHKVISHHAALEPSDLMGVQYSVPFMAACGCVIDVADPANISEALLQDLSVQRLVKKIRLVEMAENSAESWDARIEIEFNNGLKPLAGEQVGFPGSPTLPLDLEELKRKFLTVGLIGQPNHSSLMRLFETLATVDQLDRIML